MPEYATTDAPLTQTVRPATHRRPATLVQLALTSGPLGALELLSAGLVLLLLAVAVYASHVAGGGLYADDWQYRLLEVLSRQGGLLHVIDTFRGFFKFRNRPANAVYSGSVEYLFGAHPGALLAVTLAANVLASIAFYALLRNLRFERVHALVPAALLLTLPADDSIRMWWAGSPSAVATSLLFVAWSLTLWGLAHVRWRAWIAHATALVLSGVAICTYEAVLPLVVVGLLVYRLRVPWRRACRRAVPDIILSLGVYLLVTRHTVTPTQPLSGAISHAVHIAGSVRQLLTYRVIPLGVTGWWGFAAIAALVILAGGVLVGSRRMPDSATFALRRWLATGLAGLIFAALAYTTFASGPSYYEASPWGIENRVNGPAAPGLVLIAYGLVMTVSALVVVAARKLAWTAQRRRVLGAAVAAGLSVFVVIGYVRYDLQDVRAWNRAGRLAYAELAVLKRTGPPPAGWHAFVFGVPTVTGNGISVFNEGFDLENAAALAWNDTQVDTIPVVPGSTLSCTPAGVSATGAFAYTQAGVGMAAFYRPAALTPYGQTVFIDGVTGLEMSVPNSAACTRTLSRVRAISASRGL